MYKFMLIASAIFQTMISLISNERGEVLTDAEIAANEAKVLVEQQAAELKANSKKEALRDLSKELGINAFEPSELKAKFGEFTQWQTDQESEQEKLQGKVTALELKETEWESSKLKYASELMALKLNIADDNLEDVMKLAGGDPSKFEEVVKKYPNFKSKTGIHIGASGTQGTGQPGDMTEAEKYMANNPKLYGRYLKK